MAFSADEIDLMFANDLARAHAACAAIFGLAFATASSARQAALTDMVFNLGQTGLSKFAHLVDAVKRGDWAMASSEALASRWASQVGARAHEDADLIRTGVWPPA